MTPRLAAIATCAIGVSGFLAGPANAVNNYVTQPVATGVSSLTPESAVLSGAIDTGGDEGVSFSASPTNPYSFGGLTITAPAILNGIPVGLGFYSTALFEADTLADYTASGNQFGSDTVTAQAVEVPTTTGLSAVSAEIGGYPAAAAAGATLTPGTQYVYALVQQAGENAAATTVNEYDSAGLAAWASGSGSITSVGFASSSAIVNSGSKENDYSAWAAGTGSFTGDPTDPTKVPGALINPDYACVLNTAVAANTNATWAAELAAGQVPLSAGSTSLNGTALPYGINSASASGSFTATTKAQPAEQGPCVTFFGGNAANFYVSQLGSFTTPALGRIVVARKGTVAGRKATLAITDRSVEGAAGTIVLMVKKHRKEITVASGSFRVPAGATGTASLRLTSKGRSLLKQSSKLATKITLTTTTDQLSSSKSVTLRTSA